MKLSLIFVVLFGTQFTAQPALADGRPILRSGEICPSGGDTPFCYCTASNSIISTYQMCR